MAEIDIGKLSVAELESLKGGIDRAIEQKRVDELLSLRQKIDDLIEDSPFTLKEVLEAKQQRKPVSPKYRSKDDHSLTWTGRGRKPRWVVAYLEEGGKLDDILID